MEIFNGLFQHFEHDFQQNMTSILTVCLKIHNITHIFYIKNLKF